MNCLSEEELLLLIKYKKNNKKYRKKLVKIWEDQFINGQYHCKVHDPKYGGTPSTCSFVCLIKQKNEAHSLKITFIEMEKLLSKCATQDK